MQSIIKRIFRYISVVVIMRLIRKLINKGSNKKGN